MKVYLSTLEIAGTLIKGENPLPIFRDPVKDKPVKSDGTLQAEEMENIGNDTGYRVLPYRMLDKYDRNKKKISMRTAVIENDKVCVQFLPEQGGRLYSMYNKVTGKEVFSKNPVYQPCNLAILNAWFSGGIEWNIGQYGHHFNTNKPLFFAKVVTDEGYEFLRMYEFERCKRLFFQIDFHLPEGSEILYAYVRIINDDKVAKPMYWWTNVDLPERDNVRVFSGTGEVMYICPESMGDNVNPLRMFGHAKLPYLPTIPGVDSTYTMNSNYSNEFFFQNPKTDPSPWSAAAYQDEDGTLFFERSTQPLRIRKMFTWGNHAGGKRWNEFLSEPGQYFMELQSGLAPTQLNGIQIGANTTWTYMQAFGQTQLKDKKAPFQKDWYASQKVVQDYVNDQLTSDQMLEAYEKFGQMVSIHPAEVLSSGSGWGCLEGKRREAQNDGAIPDGLYFPTSSITTEQYSWLCLLEKGIIPEQDPDSIPGSWMIDEKWKPLLEESLKNKGGDHYLTHLHLGVMSYENFAFEEGIREWTQSLQMQPSVWSLRNLAVAAWREEKWEKALSYMEQAIDLGACAIDKAFAEEYIDMLLQRSEYQKVWTFYTSAIDEVKQGERVRILVGVAAVELKEYDFLEKLFQNEYACTREGDDTLVDTWFKYQAQMEAEKKGIECTDALIQEIRGKLSPPKVIDFRMVDR